MNLSYLSLLEHSPPTNYKETKKMVTNRKANQICSEVEHRTKGAIFAPPNAADDGHKPVKMQSGKEP